MNWYFIAALIAAAICLATFLIQAACLIGRGMPKDLSEKSGSVTKGVIYSFIGAMSPTQKESAYNHLPTYTAGILYHIGSFLVLAFFLWSVITHFTEWMMPGILLYPLAAVLGISAVCGVAILVKRLVKLDLRFLSSADDYISNIIVTLSQVVTALALLGTVGAPVYYITMTLLLLWLPLGKTKHLMYFFFARFHLGYFYGWRNCWPVKNQCR